MKGQSNDLELAHIPSRDRPRRDPLRLRHAAMSDFAFFVMRPYAPRDELGYRVPREGTLSRYIYNLHKQGMAPKAIAEHLGHDDKKVNVLIHRFKHPTENNARNS